MTDLQQTISRSYKSLPGKGIFEQFLKPLLSQAKIYQRETGYFSTSALVSWASSLTRLVDGDFEKIQLIGSPHLDQKDIDLLKSLTDENRIQELLQVKSENIINEIISRIDKDQDAKYEIFAWLFAHNKIELRFALWLPTPGENYSVSEADLYHKKTGIIELADGQSVAFNGSMNETFAGHQINHESIDVYRSWEEMITIDCKIKNQNFRKLGKMTLMV